MCVKHSHKCVFHTTQAEKACNAFYRNEIDEKKCITFALHECVMFIRLLWFVQYRNCRIHYTEIARMYKCCILSTKKRKMKSGWRWQILWEIIIYRCVECVRIRSLAPINARIFICLDANTLIHSKCMCNVYLELCTNWQELASARTFDFSLSCKRI